MKKLVILTFNATGQNIREILPNSEHYEPSSEHYQQLQEIAKPVREKGRVNKDMVKQVILKLCSEHYLTLRTLAELLGREPDSIRNHYVNLMIDEGLLELKYPEQINNPQQAYKTVPKLNQAIN